MPPPLSQLLLLAAVGLWAAPATTSPTQQVLAAPREDINAGSKPSHKLQGRFLHITDFHPDTFYKVHASTEEDIACHRKSGAAGYYGAETSDCDSPINLVNATFDWIADNLGGKLDFVIWTGDSARHDSDEKIPRTKSQVLETNKLLANKFVETFHDGMKIPVIPTFGNNDILPHNILPPGPNKWLGYYTDIWKKFIPEEQRHLFEHGGWFYVEVVPKKLAVFNLNTLYFFDRNAGVDDCIRHSEPGYQQMEWLRTRLDMFRKNGMKAILMGHVPPARTDSKQNWDETCWQKYTLWLRQYRDVIAGAVYGHMNIDHFMLQDTKDIDFDKMTVEWARENSLDRQRQAFNAEKFGIQSASDYLHELRTDWSKLPNPASKAVSSQSVEDEDTDDEEDYESWKKGKKGKKKNPLKKIGGKWAERYQLSLIGPSIVPNYFPTLRVIEYNITGLDKFATWADALQNPDLFSNAAALFNLESDRDEEFDDDELETDVDGYAEVETKKKKKGGKKRKKNPDIDIPDGPSKSSPPGPAYSPQPLTFTGYTQYFANLTWVNNDMTEPGEGKSGTGADKWHDGIHKDKEPKRSKPNPHKFEFKVEYSTFDDKRYKLKDLTVKNMVHLAYRIAKKKKGKGKSNSLELWPVDWEDGLEFDENEDEDFELEAWEDELGEEEKEGEGKVDADGKKKKKKKPKKHPINKVWMDFLTRAFVSTVPKKELKKVAADGGVYVADEPEDQVVLDEL